MDSNNRGNKSSYSYHPSAVTPGDLLSSAEVVAEAAMLAYNHDINKVDKGRAAGATADLLHGASHYGHIKDKPFGQYIENAEGYLYQFQSSSKASVTYSDDEGGGDHLTETAKQPKNPSSMYQSAPAKHVSKKDDWYNKPGGHGYVASGNRFGDVDDESKGGNSGGYMKQAQTFLKKQGQHAGMESEEGGFGNYMNLAQGLMKKY